MVNGAEVYFFRQFTIGTEDGKDKIDRGNSNRLCDKADWDKAQAKFDKFEPGREAMGGSASSKDSFLVQK